MNLLVLIAALMVEHLWKPLHHYRQHDLCAKYRERWLDLVSPHISASGWGSIALILIPPVLLALILFQSEQSGLSLLIQWAIAVIVLVWCLGPLSIAEKAEQLDEEIDINLSNESDAAMSLLRYAHHGYFAVVFWFVLLGPAAALLYRLSLELTAAASSSSKANQQTDHSDSSLTDEELDAWHIWMQWLDFLPARMTGLLFLLTGDFLRGFTALKQYGLDPDYPSTELVEQTGSMAIDDDADDVTLTDARHLTERSLVLLLVFAAVIGVLSL